MSVPNRYPLGSMLTLTMYFSDADDNPADPTDVSLTLVSPLGEVVAYTLSGGQIDKVTVGTYEYDFQPLIDGLWIYCWRGSGSLVAASPDMRFIASVTEAVMPPAPQSPSRLALPAPMPEPEVRLPIYTD